MFLNTWAVLNHLRHARVEGGEGSGGEGRGEWGCTPLTALARVCVQGGANFVVKRDNENKLKRGKMR